MGFRGIRPDDENALGIFDLGDGIRHGPTSKGGG
jgi:hypothetical protein